MIGPYALEPGVVDGGIESATNSLLPAPAERERARGSRQCHGILGHARNNSRICGSTASTNDLCPLAPRTGSANPARIGCAVLAFVHTPSHRRS